MGLDACLNTSGIYAIYSACNDMIYIGYSGDITGRWKGHKTDLRGGRHRNPHLQRAWNLYGEDAFEFIILEECSVELLHVREQYHLDQYPKHYNCGPGGASPRLGVPHSDETKARISRANKGRKLASETRARMSVARLGNTNTLGHKDSDETRAKKSASAMGNQNAAGQVMSPEARRKMSVARKGRTLTDEHRAKISAAQKARWERQRVDKEIC